MQCDLHSLIQVMKAVFSEVPPLRLRLYPEDCEYHKLLISVWAASLLKPFFCPCYFEQTDEQDLV